MEMVQSGGHWRRTLRGTYPAGLLFLAVFTASLGGILTRPEGLLATVWPANAVMLGILIRFPRCSSPLGWGLAAVAYMTADLLTGAPIFKALLLNGANIVGVSAAYLCFKMFPGDVLRLRTPRSMLSLLLASGIGAAGAGCLGAIANPVLFGGDALEGWQFWFVTELVNYIAFLPVILTFPQVNWRDLTTRSVRVGSVTPVLAVVMLCALAVEIKGEGAIAFPVPALFWAAVVYSPFTTAVLVLGFGWWSLFALSAGYLPLNSDPANMFGLVSVRLAISLISIAPQMLASVMASRNELLERLRLMATSDALTGTLNRSGFLESARMALNGGQSSGGALIMFDVDYFKSINDSLGHAAGDEVLSALAARAKASLRTWDILGRLGGEEFAILVTACTSEEAYALSDRVRTGIAAAPVILQDGRTVGVTVSVGFSHGLTRTSDLERHLALADDALYQAKGAGRNTVMPRIDARPVASLHHLVVNRG